MQGCFPQCDSWSGGGSFLRPIMMMEFKDCNVISWDMRDAVNKRVKDMLES